MVDTNWLEISLIVNGELAEAVAEVLARYIPSGVAIESTAVTANEDDEGGRAVGPLRVCGYLPVNAGPQANAQLEETRQKVEEALWYLGRIAPLPEVQYRFVEEQDWAEAWKQHYHPIAIGQKLIIVPAWLESPDPGRLAIRMDPGMAFGTGTHPTTQLCLELIEKTLTGILEKATHPQAFTVIDVGCGSGILSAAAVKLGAALGMPIRALGVDIDARAVEVSLENAALNGVAESYRAGVGSVVEIGRGDFGERQAGLVLANILAPIVIRLFGDGLGELVAPGGALILSGILDTQADEVIATAAQHGFHLVERCQIQDWVALRMGRDQD